MPGSEILITTCVCCFLGGLIAGVSGFGLGIIFQLCWSLADSLIGFPGSGEVKTSNAILFFCSLPIYIGMSIYEYSSHKLKHIRKHLVIGYMPGSITGIFVGTFVIAKVNSLQIERGLGIFLVVLSLERGYFVWKQYRKGPEAVDNTAWDKSFDVDEIGPPIDESIHGSSMTVFKEPISRQWFKRNRKIIILTFIASLISGLLAGLFGIGGPPIILLFSYLQLSKAEIRANSVAIFTLDIPFVAISLLAFDILHVDDWSLYFCGFFLAFIGGSIGTILYKVVRTIHVQVLLLILIFIASLSLLHIGDRDDFAWTMVAMYSIVAVCILLLFFWNYFTFKPKETKESGPIELTRVNLDKETPENKNTSTGITLSSPSVPSSSIGGDDTLTVEAPVQSVSADPRSPVDFPTPAPSPLLDPGHVVSDT